MAPRTASLLLAFGSLLLAAACSRGGSGSEMKKRPAPLVVVTQAERRELPVEVRAPVDLRAVQQTDVVSKIVGYLEAVLVDVGEPVKKGQLIATVNPSDLSGQLSSIKGTLAQSEASVALAKANWERASQLHPKGIVSQQEFDQAKAGYDAAIANRQAAQGTVAAIGSRVGETRILAPMDGFVFKRRLDPGALVGPPNGGIIFTLVQTTLLRVFVATSEQDAPRVKVGLEAHVEVDSLPGRSFKGHVVRLAPAYDPSTRTLDAEVHLSNGDGTLRPGMYGRGSIVLETKPRALVLPAGAIQYRNKKAFAFVHKGGKVALRELTTGVDGGDWLEVLTGVSEGEEVVLAGTDGLADGAEVRATKAPKLGVDGGGVPEVREAK